MKIKFNSDDDLPLNKILKFRILTIIIRNIFEKDGECYPQMFWTTVSVKYKCYNMKELTFLKELM